MKRLPLLLALASLAACAKAKSGAPASSPADASTVAYGGDAASASEAPGEAYSPGGAEGESAKASAMGGAADGESYDYAEAEESAGDDMMAEAAPMPEPASAPSMDEAAAPAIAGRSRAAKKGRRSKRKESRKPMKTARRDRRRPPVEPEPEPDFNRQAQAGRLTAGAFDDTLNPDVLSRFAERMAQQSDTREVANRVVGEMTIVRIVDERGRPIHDAEVRLDTDRRGAKVPTGTDGRAIFFAGWDLPPEGHRQGKVQAVIEHGRERMSVPIREGTINTIKMRNVQARSVDAVDIALVIDATGSMGDELEYLKVELRNIARTIERSFPRVDQRFALVVYRDDGDDFVSRSFDFSNLSRFEDQLGRQSAGGGGDYPEAMDAALEDAADLSWSRDSAKVVFLVADAPPHAQQMRRTMDAVDDLRARGAAFYPVAASGVASEAEIVMRAAAAGSGGQYVFLTDDSGVGNTHAEPHIPCYEVQALRDIMIRMVHTELAGERISANSRQTIRSVGRSNDGVCEVSARAR